MNSIDDSNRGMNGDYEFPPLDDPSNGLMDGGLSGGNGESGEGRTFSDAARDVENSQSSGPAPQNQQNAMTAAAMSAAPAATQSPGQAQQSTASPTPVPAPGAAPTTGEHSVMPPTEPAAGPSQTDAGATQSNAMVQESKPEVFASVPNTENSAEPDAAPAASEAESVEKSAPDITLNANKEHCQIQKQEDSMSQDAMPTHTPMPQDEDWLRVIDAHIDGLTYHQAEIIRIVAQSRTSADIPALERAKMILARYTKVLQQSCPAEATAGQ